MLYLKKENNTFFLEEKKLLKVISPNILDNKYSHHFIKEIKLLNKEKNHHVLIPFLEIAKYNREEEKSPNLFCNFLSTVLEQKNISLHILDCHTVIPKKYQNNVFNISPIVYLKNYLKLFNFKNSIFISPDQGAKTKVKKLANIFQRPCVSFLKDKRKTSFLLLENNKKHILKNKTCLIVDDILDTGKTINGMIQEIEKYDIKNFVLYVTHVIKKETLLDIANYEKCIKIIITNSIEEAIILHPKVDCLMLRKTQTIP